MASSSLVSCAAATECVSLGETTGAGSVTFCLCGQPNLELWVTEQIADSAITDATSDTTLCEANWGYAGYINDGSALNEIDTVALCTSAEANATGSCVQATHCGNWFPTMA